MWSTKKRRKIVIYLRKKRIWPNVDVAFPTQFRRRVGSLRPDGYAFGTSLVLSLVLP